MTHRDPPPEIPACPICDSVEQVKSHDNPHQGRWLATCHMVLFDGTSAAWHRPEREPQDITDELEAARAALREAETSGS